MAFTPQSSIALCSVPFDATYKNQIYFDDITSQSLYFNRDDICKRIETNYTTVRRTTAGGGLERGVKVGLNIEVLERMGINYLVFKNYLSGGKTYYCFIKQFVYINEETTEIIYETDVYQTWLFDVRLLRSYVVREHTASDTKGGNLIAEQFNFQDFTYKEVYEDTTLDEWGYLIGCSNAVYDTESDRGKEMSGIYQGLFFYYFKTADQVNEFLDVALEKEGDIIQFISLIPEFCVDNVQKTNGRIFSSAYPEYKSINLPKYGVITGKNCFQGYEPNNNKLYSSPFVKLVVSNHNGEQAEYNIEDFAEVLSDGRIIINFYMYADLSAKPSIVLYPTNYKGISQNYDCGISITSFPQCSFVTDTYKLWLAKNQYSMGINTVSGAISGVASAVTGNIQGVINSAVSVANTMNSQYQASREPNKVNSGDAKNNLLTAMGMNKFSFYIKSLKMHDARMVDDYFTMFGYQVNEMKIPNVSCRPCFNYVQTIDVNIEGDIPFNDMARLKQMYNEGVTFWKPDAVFGNYDIDNSPL